MSSAMLADNIASRNEGVGWPLKRAVCSRRQSRVSEDGSDTYHCGRLGKVD